MTIQIDRCLYLSYSRIKIIYTEVVNSNTPIDSFFEAGITRLTWNESYSGQKVFKKWRFCVVSINFVKSFSSVWPFLNFYGLLTMTRISIVLSCLILFIVSCINVTTSQQRITAEDLGQIIRALSRGTNNNTILDANAFINRVLGRTTRRTTTTTTTDNSYNYDSTTPDYYSG